jgi:hypothetical protein
MADLICVFNRISYNIGLGFDWTTDPVRALLVDADTWTPNRDDDFVQTILSAGAVEMSGGSYARDTLTTPTVGLDDPNDRAVWSGDPFNFGTVTGTDPYDTMVIYRFVTNDTDSWLIAAFDLGANVANSTAIEVQPSVADGWRYWSECFTGS